ncbi:hypothetical protein MYCTH_2294471 [Thermothelomyces thermophilus ATCC 42464]|uniref:DUF1772-domain-containing protein n=1 Tax=Thermothelomyces thermophilus (strain ATCC 42464 / BCRC 31852 / DSM 1799) TaxID=573729 RepID=G2Q1C8_THET4|nr:uncharacterized protein MYCTH_2294471 [Thermothelomyces thermophilus ATCC 42464]AEO53320.1 hypothetical protein MYCTH_2294471 [Thermothelomyces thermophilus ATCC 42464]
MANTQDTAPCRLAQATALLLGTLSAGANLTLSAFLVPRLLESPTPLMLRQWVRTYRRGAATVPFAAGLAAAAYTYLYYYLGTRGGGAASASALLRARAYLAAGALTIGIVPYTLAVMAGTNSELKRMERAVGEVAGADAAEVPAGEEEEVVVVEEESAKRLVDWWGVLNLGRGVLLLAGSICGLAATL